MIELEWIKERVISKEYLFTLHGDKERQYENLLISEVIEALNNSIIIENYKDTGRGESCLAAGYTKEGKPLHIVCGELNNKLAIITVYIPSLPKFKNLYERASNE